MPGLGNVQLLTSERNFYAQTLVLEFVFVHVISNVHNAEYHASFMSSFQSIFPHYS